MDKGVRYVNIKFSESYAKLINHFKLLPRGVNKSIMVTEMVP